MTIEIVSFPINSMVIFHSYVNVYQRVRVFKSSNLSLKPKATGLGDGLKHVKTYDINGLHLGSSSKTHGHLSTRTTIHLGFLDGYQQMSISEDEKIQKFQL